MLTVTGVPTAADLAAVTPSPERMRQGPVAIFECFQKIPCNPCWFSCRQGAIEEFADLNDLPKVDANKCSGCGICVANCPGLAVFIIDYTYSPDEGLIKIPYEYLPLPEVNAVVEALDREGRPVGTARIVRVQRIRGQEKTPLIWLALPQNLLMTVRNIRVGVDRHAG